MTMHGRLSFWAPNKPEVLIGLHSSWTLSAEGSKAAYRGFTHLKHCINLLICVHSDCLSKQFTQDERAIHSVNFLVAIEPYEQTTYVYLISTTYGIELMASIGIHTVNFTALSETVRCDYYTLIGVYHDHVIAASIMFPS